MLVSNKEADEPLLQVNPCCPSMGGVVVSSRKTPFVFQCLSRFPVVGGFFFFFETEMLCVLVFTPVILSLESKM